MIAAATVRTYYGRVDIQEYSCNNNLCPKYCDVVRVRKVDMRTDYGDCRFSVSN